MQASAVRAPYNQACTATLNRLMQETPGIKRAAFSSNPGIFVSSDPEPIVVTGQSSAGGQGYRMSVDAGFLPMTGAQLLAGRLFDPNSAYDRTIIDAYPNFPKPMFEAIPVVVTRAMLPVLGASSPEDALGKRFNIGGGFSFWAKSSEIIGVIEDWRQRPLQYEVTPIVFAFGGTIMMPIAEIDEADVPAVQKALSPPGGFTGDYGPFRISLRPLTDAYSHAYAADRNLMGAVSGFAALAIFVACLGVYGLSAFDMRRRVREVGIRKALGATPARVAGMMFWKQMRFAAIASAFAWPLAWWISNGWLETYVYRTALGPVVLPAASLIILAFVALAVGLNTARAAAIRPSFALRTAA
jgi:putative ABC transport system permease protein